MKRRINSVDRYEKVKALAERGSTEHERDTAARILAGLRSPAQEARAALEAARAKEAQQVAAAYRVLHELRPGDKVEVIFEGKSLTSPNDKRTVTVTSVEDFGQDRKRYVFTTSGKVMPGIPAGGMIRVGFDGNDVQFQPTMRTPVKRVVSLRVVGVAPKGAALLGAKTNPRKTSAVMPRQAQAAVEAIGWERALQIVGPAGLSGASQRDLKRLLMVAGLVAKQRNPSAHALAALRADYQEASAEYTNWARIEDRLTDRERRAKEAAYQRMNAAWVALKKAEGSLR